MWSAVEYNIQITTQTMKTCHMSLWYCTGDAIMLPFMLVAWQSIKWFIWPSWYVTSYDQVTTVRSSEDQQTCFSWFWNYCSVCRQRMLRFTYLNCCAALGLSPRTLWLDRFFRASWFLFFFSFLHYSLNVFLVLCGRLSCCSSAFGCT